MKTESFTKQITQYFFMGISLILGLAIASMVTGCDSQVTESDIAKQVRKIDHEKAQLAAMKDRKEFEAEMQSKLQALEVKVKTLSQQADEATGDKQVELRGEIAKLETKCEQMQTELNELKAASGDLWAKTKLKAEETWNDVSSSVENTVSDWKKKFDEKTDAKK